MKGAPACITLITSEGSFPGDGPADDVRSLRRPDPADLIQAGVLAHTVYLYSILAA